MPTETRILVDLSLVGFIGCCVAYGALMKGVFNLGNIFKAE